MLILSKPNRSQIIINKCWYLWALLGHDSPQVRSAAARDLMDVSVPFSGKEAACDDVEIVPLLVRLLSDPDYDVKANAAGALMTIAITTKGSKVENNEH